MPGQVLKKYLPVVPADAVFTVFSGGTIIRAY